jgi:hypothetical protein
MGWIRADLERVRRLKAQLRGDAFVVVNENSDHLHLTAADFYANFTRNSERLRAHYSGDEVPPLHPVGEALKGAANPLPRLLEQAAENQRKLDAQIEEPKRQQ